MKKTTVVLGLELDERNALAGRIDAGDRRIPFRGWLGLVAALDRLLDGEDAAAAPVGGGHQEGEQP